jgi:hypothetical protein
MRRRLFILWVFCMSFWAESSSQTLTQAKNWYLQNDYQKALPVFGNELKKRPRDPSLNLWYGACLLETGKTELSKSYLETARQKSIMDADYFLARYFMKIDLPDSALVLINHYLAFPKLENAKKDAAINLKTDIETHLGNLQKVEDICFIDSIIVLKSALYTTVKISPDAGTIVPVKPAFPDAAKTLGMAYLTEKNDRGFYASAYPDKGYDIVARHRLLENWDKEEPLSNIINSEADEMNPYYLSDGTTLYFASNRPGTFGGFDLYVTRQSKNNTYLLPDHLNMPFNSPANDYFLIIDEFSNRGYLATDRNQPKGYVAIYTFLPNPTNVMLQGKSLQELQDFANIRSIKATWEGKNLDSLLQQPKKPVFDTVSHEPDIVFIMNDQLSYHQESDFVSSEARNLYRTYRTLNKQLIEESQTLNKKRECYLQAGTEQKAKLTEEILKLEKDVFSLKQQLPVLETQIRNLELSKRSK